MTPRRARAFAPATIANLGPGFDALGLALESPGDFAVAERTGEPGLSFSMVRPATERRTGRGRAPARRPAGGRPGADTPAPADEARLHDPARNIAARVARLLLEETKPKFGVRLTLDKRMPIGSGLGSSAASGVAALVAVNALLPKPLPKRDLLRFAVEGERMASGSPHADNAAPCLLGGVQLILRPDPPDVAALPFRNTFHWIVVHPHVVLETKTARRLLPRSLPLATAVHQWAHTAGLAAGLASGDIALVGRSLSDLVAEPVRAALIPGFAAVRSAALASGAVGCSISGSGPSLFAVAATRKLAERAGRAMALAFRSSAGLDADVTLSRINRRGARITARS